MKTVKYTKLCPEINLIINESYKCSRSILGLKYVGQAYVINGLVYIYNMDNRLEMASYR